MDLLSEGFSGAWNRLTSGDAETFHALRVSLVTSIVAVAIAALLAIPFGAWLGLFRPRGSRLLVFVARLGLAVPTVVIGLLLWALLSRRGLLGELGLLYSQPAITIGLALLALPVLVTQVHAATRNLDPRVRETMRTLGAGPWRTLRWALGECRHALVTALLLAFHRCITELGIALIVGGGIRFHTRTLPAEITLELSKGDFGRALAPAIPLMVVAVVFTAVTSWGLSEERA